MNFKFNRDQAGLSKKALAIENLSLGVKKPNGKRSPYQQFLKHQADREFKKMTVSDFMADSSHKDAQSSNKQVSFSNDFISGFFGSDKLKENEVRSSLENTQTSGFGDEEANKRLFDKLNSPLKVRSSVGQEDVDIEEFNEVDLTQVLNE